MSYEISVSCKKSNLKEECYSIQIEADYSKLTETVKGIMAPGQKICIVTDSNVEKLYAEEIKSLLQPLFSEVFVYSFEAGEQQKNIMTAIDLFSYLIEKNVNRSDMLLALGGGVVGDLTGFVAATYMRGIRFIQVPTTLLSQVDSSIGGKTGVDCKQYKNMVGAFWMPCLVYMNTSVLQTLPIREFSAGMGEVMKSALIKDADYYEWLISNFNEINNQEQEVLEEMIYRCCLIKKRVVEKDPTEQGERALLNFGHTLGHAIETSKGFTLLHGECVALGCVAAAYISWKKELLSMEEYYEIRDMFVPFGLPISIEDINPEQIVKLTASDKKAESGHIKFILLKKIGKAVIDTSVTEEEMLSAINEIYYKEESAND
ncbi:MAG TPA: 3-dehydroquinate synthase [Lachnospiraceae bacterium]|nr:3-dehydroquinate synthase [Lachnospiraceae bacterium]